MLFRQLLATAGLLSLASATAQLPNQWKGGPTPDDMKNDKLCLPQGPGSWTFSMFTSEVEVPVPDGSNPNAGNSANAFFIIYDEGCNIRGTYTANGEIPWYIEENFLKQVLTITKVDFDIGQPYFSFDYGNGKFSIRNNHCGCQDMGGGLAVNVGCKCAFPVSGVLT